MSPSPRLSHNVPVLLAGPGLRILRSDVLNLGAVSGFTVSGIAGDHAVFVQKMQVSIMTLSRQCAFIPVVWIHIPQPAKEA